MADDPKPPAAPDPSEQIKSLTAIVEQSKAQLQALQQEKAAVEVARKADSDRLSTQLARGAVKFAAASAGITNHTLADVLPIDGVKVDISSGQVTGADDVIAKWKTSYPEIFHAPAAGGAPPPATTNTPATSPAGTGTPASAGTPLASGGTPVQPFGPGVTTPADGGANPGPADVRSMNEKDYRSAKGKLLELAAKSDAQTSNTAAAMIASRR